MAYESTIKNIVTDVLILGSGGAGCCAAVAASKEGCRVLLADKAKLEGSGSICGGNDHFMANLNTGPEWDSDDAVADCMKRSHEGMSAGMIKEHWVKRMPAILSLLEEIGLEFFKNPDGSYLRTTGFAQPGPWWLNIKNGWYIKKLLARKLRSMDIDVLDHIMITSLIKTGERVTGAFGFNILDGTFYVINAKAVIIALGRDANRSSNNSTLNPFNITAYPYNTGSNNVLAYNCGAKIQNLEINETGTLSPKGFGCPGMNGLNSMGGHELNAFGERFMGKYDPQFWENTVRRKQIAATYQELVKGQGPPFYMDMRHIPENDRSFLQNVLMPGDKATFLDYMEQIGITFATHPMEMEISEIHLAGRIVINERLQTTVKGLLSGCNFHFLSGAMCGGYSSGLEAAAEAKTIKGFPDVSKTAIEEEKEQVFRPLLNTVGLNPREYENIIRQVMDYYMGYIRNGKSIDLAIEKLNLIESHFNDVKAADLHELLRAHEARHLLKHCQLSARGCAERKESGRTLYVRSDYPDPDESMNRCLIQWQENGNHFMEFGASL